MAKKRSRVYNLYTRCANGAEPRVSTRIEGVGEPILVPKYGTGRGALIYTTNSYKRLVNHARYLAWTIGMPKSRCWDIFDWNNPS